MDSSAKYDVLTFGRSSIDLYSNDIGAPFEEISSFGAFVGGSSTNIAVSCSRLSLHTALLTAIGDDQVGKFIMRFLHNEGIVTSYIPTVEGRTSAVILGIEPPDRFPLVYYRNNAADLQITIDHVLETGLDQFKVIVLSGNALSRDPSKTSTLFAAEHANQLGVPLFLDLDFRADQWFDPRAYGVMVRSLLPRVKVVIGTEEEVLAASLRDSSQVTIKHQQSAREALDCGASFMVAISTGLASIVGKWLRLASGDDYVEEGDRCEKIVVEKNDARNVTITRIFELNQLMYA